MNLQLTFIIFFALLSSTIVLYSLTLPEVDAATATLTPSIADTTISDNSTKRDTNFGSEFKICVDPGNYPTDPIPMPEFYNLRRSLVKFDLSSIPPGSPINSARLQLYVNFLTNRPEAEGETLTVYQVTEDWAEMEATWNDRFTSPSTQSWTNPGGTWTVIGATSVTIPSDPVGYWIEWTVTDIVKAWIENGEPNYGFIIVSDSEKDWSICFISRTGSNNPILEVDYTPPPDLSIKGDGIINQKLRVSPCSEFLVNIHIDDIPNGYTLDSFDFTVTWDPSLMEVVGDPVNYATERSWPNTFNRDDLTGNIYLNAFDPTGSGWGDDVWLSITFHCLGEGSSQITVSTSEGDTVVLKDQSGTTLDTFPDPYSVTCNQYQPRQPPRSYLVGGVIMPVDKPTVLAPYLILVGLVATVSLTYIMRKRKV